MVFMHGREFEEAIANLLQEYKSTQIYNFIFHAKLFLITIIFILVL